MENEKKRGTGAQSHRPAASGEDVLLGMRRGEPIAGEAIGVLPNGATHRLR